MPAAWAEGMARVAGLLMAQFGEFSPSPTSESNLSNGAGSGHSRVSTARVARDNARPLCVLWLAAWPGRSHREAFGPARRTTMRSTTPSE